VCDLSSWLVYVYLYHTLQLDRGSSHTLHRSPQLHSLHRDHTRDVVLRTQEEWEKRWREQKKKKKKKKRGDGSEREREREMFSCEIEVFVGRVYHGHNYSLHRASYHTLCTPMSLSLPRRCHTKGWTHLLSLSPSLSLSLAIEKEGKLKMKKDEG